MSHRIRVEVNLAPAHRVHTLAHQLGNALLHVNAADRGSKEIEAESVAFVVRNATGIRSDDWSLGYVAGWASGGDQAIAAIKTAGPGSSGPPPESFQRCSPATQLTRRSALTATAGQMATAQMMMPKVTLLRAAGCRRTCSSRSITAERHRNTLRSSSSPDVVRALTCAATALFQAANTGHEHFFLR